MRDILEALADGPLTRPEIARRAHSSRRRVNAWIAYLLRAGVVVTVAPARSNRYPARYALAEGGRGYLPAPVLVVELGDRGAARVVNRAADADQARAWLEGHAARGRTYAIAEARLWRREAQHAR